MPVKRCLKVGFRAVVVIWAVILLQGAVCANRQMVAWHFDKKPNDLLFYQALALDIPKARLIYFHRAKDWSVAAKLRYLRHESLKHDAQAHLLIATTLFEDGQYDRALQWTNNTSVAGNSDSLLLKGKIYLAQQRYEQARLLLLGRKEPAAKAMLARSYLAFGDFKRAQALLEGNTSQYALRLNQRLTKAMTTTHKTAVCKLKLQLLASDLNGLEYAAGLIEKWRNKASYKQLPICLLEPQGFDPSALGCVDEVGKRQSCQLTKMAARLAIAADVLPVIVYGAKGKANYNNGIIFINRLKSFGVFAHELMHHFGFLDEYALAHDTAQSICAKAQAGFVGENLYILPQGQAPEGMIADMVKVATCDATSAQAYKLVKPMTLMEFMDQSLPPLYLDKIKDKLHNRQQQMANYQYAYALAFERRGQLDEYRFWLNASAANGYFAAKVLLGTWVSTQK